MTTEVTLPEVLKERLKLLKNLNVVSRLERKALENADDRYLRGRELPLADGQPFILNEYMSQRDLVWDLSVRHRSRGSWGLGPLQGTRTKLHDLSEVVAEPLIEWLALILSFRRRYRLLDSGG